MGKQKVMQTWATIKWSMWGSLEQSIVYPVLPSSFYGFGEKTGNHSLSQSFKNSLAEMLRTTFPIRENWLGTTLF